MLEEEEGGGQQDSCLVAKQAVEFPQVLASILCYCILLKKTVSAGMEVTSD